MKRKISEPNRKDPKQIRSPSQRDISRKKGVKFTNLDEENRRPERSESAADNAKTSEYAFFKKLKEDASHIDHSCSRSKEVYQSRNSKSGDSSRERINMVQNKSEEVRSAVIDIGDTLDKCASSYALPGSASRDSELNRTRACGTLEDLHRIQNYMAEESKNTLKPNGKGLNHFEERETQYGHADVFHRKRQKLLHRVRETSFPEIDDLCANGYNFVSELLSRLIPKCNVNKKSRNPKLMQVAPDDRSMPLPSFESDIHFKALQWAPSKSIMELGCDPYLGDDTLSCWSKKSREMVSCSYSPSGDAYKNHLEYTVWEPDSELLGGSAISCMNSDSNSILPFKEYGLVTPGHVKELDVFYQSNDYIGREPCAPLLGWNFDRTDEERRLSNLSRYRADSELLVGNAISCAMSNSDYVCPFKKYELRTPSQVKELDVFCQPNEYMLRKELCAPMLDWNFDSTHEDTNLCSLSSYRADSKLLGGSAISCAICDTDFVLPCKGYRLRASSQVKEMDGFCSPNEYLVGREPCALMLGWDFDSTNEKRNSCSLSRSSDEHSSAFLASFHSHDVERQFPEGKYDLQSDFHHLETPLTLSCIPTFLNRAEGRINDRAWEGGTTFFSLQNDHWFTQKIINEGNPYPIEERLLQLSDLSREHYSSTCHALQFPREEGLSSHLLTFDHKNDRCPDDSSHKRTLTRFIEDNVSIHDSSALCLQISLDGQKARNLGIDIDKSSWDGSDKEMSFDDGDVKYNQW
ncbi:hypothetical protein M0R45_010459 [Rubus argutus]|uniref:Uncharacterized protein n=1 Tax=Rubus argutus TaxID=59490 RepID=A0AAW1Y7E5_RUBAR